MDTSRDTMLMEAIAAARAGDRSRARDLLTRLLRADSTNPEYWIWMSAVVDSPREKVYCLESALKLDPGNRAARRGLVLLGARKPDETDLAAAVRPPKGSLPSAAPSGGLGGSFSLPIPLPWLGAGLIGLVGLGLLVGLFSWLQRPRPAVVAPTLPPPSSTATATPLEPTATNTPEPVEVRLLRTPIPTELALTPIVFFVEATPTPTPMLGVTPHPSFEAYAAAVRALERGDYETALEFLNQVLELDEDLPDVHYLRGEALRMLGRPAEATLAYDQAIRLAPDFAPAYLGRARALLAIARREKGDDIRLDDLPSDYEKVLELDPTLVDAYIDLANFYAELRLWKTLEETLTAALEAGARAPILYIRLSEAQYHRGRYEQALENAMIGSADDPTLLDGYLALGRAFNAVGDYRSALPALLTYVAYRGDDHRGWSALGRARFALGDLEGALEALDRALEINDRYAPAYQTRGEVYLALEDPEAALSDLFRARQYGPESFDLYLAIGRAQYLLADYVEALKSLNQALSLSETQAEKAQVYALRGLVYEATNPPLTEDAIRNWRWVLELENAPDDLKAMATDHLLALGAEPVTTTPTPTASRTPTPTPTPTP